jgi:hypothetical protein
LREKENTKCRLNLFLNKKMNTYNISSCCYKTLLSKLILITFTPYIHFWNRPIQYFGIPQNINDTSHSW